MKPKKVEFGTEFNDCKWKDLDLDFKITFFHNGDINYVVLFRNGHIGFGYNLNKTLNVDEIKTYKDLKDKFRFDTNKSLTNVIVIFNEVFYAILDYIKKNQPEEFYFNGSNSDLIKFYEFMVKDKNFLESVHKEGYIYEGFCLIKINQPKHMFSKKEKTNECRFFHQESLWNDSCRSSQERNLYFL